MNDRQALRKRGGACRAVAGVGVVLVAAALAVLGADPRVAMATELDTGTIYFFGDGGIQEMAPDGTGRTSVAADVDYYSEPSILLHGGRWFLHVDEVSGQTYPDGRPRLELMAIHEDGTSRIQLTDGQVDEAGTTFIEPNNGTITAEGGLRAQARWTDLDRKVSYLALRTSYDADGNRSVQDGGLYSLTVNPNRLSSHAVVAMSDAPLVSMALTPPGHMLLWPSYAWKPDGSAVVFHVPPDQGTTAGMWRALTSDGFANPTLLTESSTGEYRWSPDGTQILFHGGLETGIKVIDADGSNEALLVADPVDLKKEQRYIREGGWSPNGTHIVYCYLTRNLKTGAARWDIWRATSTGSSATNLTSSSDRGGSFPKWGGAGNPPTVTITRPADGSTVWGTAVIQASAADDGIVSEVEFFVDGLSIGTDTSYPYEISWDSSGVSDGDHTISANATDESGETGSDSVLVDVDNVDDPPSVTVTAPTSGATVSGSLTIAAEATDDGAVVQVQFFVGAVLIGTDTTSPYQVTWNSTTVADGGHTITAVATDNAGKTASGGISVNVMNTAPVLTVTSVAPNTMKAGSSIGVTVGGTGFVAGATLKFTNGTKGTPTASNVVVVSATTITATVQASEPGMRS